MIKNSHAMKLFALAMLFACVSVAFTGCKEEGDPFTGEVPGMVFANGAVAQIVNQEIKEGTSKKQIVQFKLRVKTNEAVDVQFNYDESLIDYVNKKNKKDYAAFPSDLLVFSKNDVRVEIGKTASDSLELTINSGEGLVKNKEYLIPLKATVKNSSIYVPEKDSYLGVVVKPTEDKTNKPTGIKIFSCMEINVANPLNHLNFKLEKSGKYLFDAVILFSANMQYNEKTKKVHMSLNPKNKYLFDNADKYIKPLQDEGIKVLFSILPHHTAAGLANLTDEACKSFAAEVKKFNDAYDLDGVFLDDEYGYKGTGDPAIVHPEASINAASRLAYEIKKVMPDKWVTIYAYNILRQMESIEGQNPGSFVDYILPDYYDKTDYSSWYEGLPLKQTGICSLSLSSAYYFYYVYEDGLKMLREDGFGANMVYGLKPQSYIRYSQLKVLEKLTEILFDDKLIIKDQVYQSDWDDLGGEPVEWTGK